MVCLFVQVRCDIAPSLSLTSGTDAPGTSAAGATMTLAGASMDAPSQLAPTKDVPSQLAPAEVGADATDAMRGAPQDTADAANATAEELGRDG